MLTMSKNHYKQKYESRTEALERLVESQRQTIETLEIQLRNERYRHNQTRNSPKSNGITSIED